jgi:hypothetical protein
MLSPGYNCGSLDVISVSVSYTHEIFYTVGTRFAAFSTPLVVTIVPYCQAPLTPSPCDDSTEYRKNSNPSMEYSLRYSLTLNVVESTGVSSLRLREYYNSGRRDCTIASYSPTMHTEHKCPTRPSQDSNPSELIFLRTHLLIESGR